MLNIGRNGIECAKRILSAFFLKEVVKLMSLHFLKDGSYTHRPLVNHLLPVPGLGLSSVLHLEILGLK